MSQITTLSTVTKATVVDAFHAVADSMVTFDKKGKSRGFAMSIAFAAKDERTRLMTEIFARQCESGNYGPLINEVLAEGIVPKGQREVIEMMLGAARRPSKATTRSFCAIIIGLHDKLVSLDKTPKGKKMVLFNMVTELSALIGKEDTTADDAARTLDAQK